MALFIQKCIRTHCAVSQVFNLLTSSGPYAFECARSPTASMILSTRSPQFIPPPLPAATL